MLENQKNKQTKNERDRSKNKNIETKLLELKRKKPKTPKCNETENLDLRLNFLYHANTSYRSTIIEIEIYTMQTHLTVPQSSLSSWMPYASP